MLRVLTFCLLNILFLSNIDAQKNRLLKMANVKHNGDWVVPYSDNLKSPENFLEEFKESLGMSPADHFQLKDTKEDHLGFKHLRYQQYYKDVPVEGAEYILHIFNNTLRSGNGKLVHGIHASTTPAIHSQISIEIVKNFIAADQYYWEIPEMEKRIKHISKDPRSTFYPNPKLVFVNQSFNQKGKEYKLAWKLSIYSTSKHGEEILYVDATNGKVLFSLDNHCGVAVQGIAETRYHGTRSITTDSVSPTEYRLIDVSRGGGIETYDLNESVIVGDAVHFVDEDNYWNNHNEELDDAATDVHWGMATAYDYFLGTYDRNSFDNQGAPIVSYVHYDVEWRNASWTGMWFQFGDGLDNPLTSIDIVSHELTHGVTSHSAQLIYKNESGALNESFSDIFGTGIEFHALPSEANWVLGLEDFTFRDMSDPKRYFDPDTYKGTYWYNGTNDNGGVHTNSGVQNYWFYLLSEGGSGNNDNNDFYDIEPIGMEKALAIAYRSLTTYLSQASKFQDARLGSIIAAEDLFGSCSFEVNQVAKAWHAVGVGLSTISHDFQLLAINSLSSSCNIGTDDILSIDLKYNRSGCGHTIMPGDSIAVSYRIDSNSPVSEIIHIESSLSGGEILSHSFETPLNFDEGLHEIDVWAEFEKDQITSNNIILNHIVTKPIPLEQNKSISFEYSSIVKDSFYTEIPLHALASISVQAKNTGSLGFELGGFGATLENTIIPEDESENFELNPDFGALVCFCVDARNWDSASLNFDLKQGYSLTYFDLLGLDFSSVISLRVLVNGDQIGEQFHPETNMDDPYLTHVMNLDEYAGTEFNLCFEGRHFLSKEEDVNDGPGDFSYLDNIIISESPSTAIEEKQIPAINIYPNPLFDKLNIDFGRNSSKSEIITIVDILGKKVFEHFSESNNSKQVIDLSGLPSGLYLISIQSGELRFVESLVIK